LDSIKVFNLLITAISSWAGNYVSKPIYESKSPLIGEVYFYVLNQNIDLDLGHQEQIIIKIRVNEEKSVVMLHIGAKKNPTVNGVLTHIWHLVNEKYNEQFGYKFNALHCPLCGASIENLECTQDLVKCDYCGEEFEKN